MMSPASASSTKLNQLIDFRLEANVNTYAAFMNEAPSSHLDSHDFCADRKMPYRGPEYFEDGEYTYKCSVNGDFSWFQGYEEIYCKDSKVYECISTADL